MDLLVTAAVLLLCVILHFLLQWKKPSPFVKQGVPVTPTLPFIGCYELVTKGFPQALLHFRQKYGKVYGMKFMGMELWSIGDADMLKEVLIRQFGSFPNRRRPPTKDRPLHTKGIVSLEDQKWKDVRSLLTPAFSGNKMKKIALLVNSACDQMVEHFDEKRHESFVQCKDLFGSYVMDVLAASFFGLTVDSQKNENDPFVTHAKKGFNADIKSPKVLSIALFPKLGKIFDLFDIGIVPKTTRKFFMEVTERTINLRRKSNDSKRTDILQLMMDAHEESAQLQTDEKKQEAETNTESSKKKKPLEMEEIMANSCIFFIAGYETTNATLCFASYLLATHPEIQERLINEVDDKAPTPDDVTYDIMTSMEYLDCVVMEALRYYPPVVMMNRKCNKTFSYKSYTINEGEHVAYPIYSIHHDHDYWPEPDKFDPERFNKENRPKNHPCAWLPFGAGPRNCLGMRLAMMEIKFGLVRLLQRFKFVPCAETPIPLQISKSFFIIPEEGIKLQIEPRTMSHQDLSI